MARTKAGAPPFPDCWTAYGATNPELRSYRGVPRLVTGMAWAVLLGQVGIAVVLAAVVASAASPVLRVVALVAVCAVLGSAVIGVLRLLATARLIAPHMEHLRLTRAVGPAANLPWEQIGEIALAQLPTRQAVGLRLRPGATSGLPPPLRAMQRRVCSDFDFLLFPADGKCDLLGRVLLRYCIDREARRRFAGAPE